MMQDDSPTDEAAEREALERQRASILHRLPVLFDAIARKGAAATSFARSAFGGSTPDASPGASSGASSPLRAAALGAAAGVAVTAAGLWALQRRRASRRLDRRIARALVRLVEPPRPSPFAAVASAAARAAFDLAGSFARELLAREFEAPPALARATQAIPPLPPRPTPARLSTVVSAAPSVPPPFAPAAPPPAARVEP